MNINVFIKNLEVIMFRLVQTFMVLIYFGFFCVGVYITALMIKLARRGIEALDIYIDNNQMS